ncbi:hypothetical protein MMC13_005321 [Lambiella insularis]|nr:hypothetical protein [Lambiella insularis]
MAHSENLAVSTDSSRASPPDDHILEALRERRKSIDRDIAEYKALKDTEYRQFEEQLRATTQTKPSMGSTVSEQSSNGTRSTGKLDLQRIDMGDRPKPALRPPPGSMQERLRSEKGAILSMTEGDSVSGEQSGIKTTVLETPFHEREIEFQGLFTLRYLPLLENGRQHRRNSGDRPSSPPPSALTDRSDSREDRSAVLSSSATLPALTYHPSRSPTQPSKLSNSVPGPMLSDKRRSSSRSDISVTSLRSSLRQAKSPRSPKHVLFAIDNRVLSPGTSPVAPRTTKTPPIPFSGLKDMPTSAVEEKSEAPGQINDPARDYYNPKIVPEPITQSIAVSPSSISSRSYRELVEPTVSASKDDLEDFQDIGQDDVLFSFDDDGNTKDDEPVFKEKETGSESDEGMPSLLPSSSPHAGSLPIEIKWPASRRPKK